MFLSVIIPAYNEENTIPIFIEELENSIRQCKKIKKYEILIIDDHSTDNTFNAVKKLGKKNIKIIRLSRRSGSHVALRAGLSQVSGDGVLCMAADGQDNPSVISKMIEKLSNGKNVIWGVRKSRSEPLLQMVFAKIFYLILSVFTENLNPKIDLANADFYLIDRQVADAINQCPERNTSLFGLLVWLGFSQDFVNYDRRERFSGKSKWNYRARLRLATDWVIAFSGAPLKVIIMLGLLFSILGMLYTIFIFIYYFLGYAKPGWAETVVLILVTSGVQMTMLGIIGEYLWHSLDETRKRPLFFIEKMHKIVSD